MNGEPFKWQRILDRECPKCGADLKLHETKKGDTYFNCTACEFGIGCRHLIHMLTNPHSAISRHLSSEQRQWVIESFKRAMA